MPLQDGDIVVDRIVGVQVSGAQGHMVRGLQYRFTVRGHGPFYVEVPEEKFDANHTHQLIMKYAADQVDLLDRFASRG
jgi:hypothetical protein